MLDNGRTHNHFYKKAMMMSKGPGNFKKARQDWKLAGRDLYTLEKNE